MIQVREYGTLTCDPEATASIDRGIVSPSTFDWLLGLQSSWKSSTSLLHQEGRHLLKLDSCVGFLQSPSGESIEILPKTQMERPTQTELRSLRQLLRKMVLSTLRLKPREAGRASLRVLESPIHEWILSCFLAELATLVRKGLRSDYLRVEEESRFVRGRLEMTKQLRQRPDRAHWFHLRHDIFSPESVENRLLKTAVSYTLQLTKDSRNWQLASELAHLLQELPSYRNPLRHLPKWRSSKLMKAYSAVRPWCELVLEKFNPGFQQGHRKGVALLFPMFRLFEDYVGRVLQRQLPPSCSLTTQASGQFLVQHQPPGSEEVKSWFQLRPDFLLKSPEGVSLLDAKWKLLQVSSGHYGLSQSDMFQLFAYGHRYMKGRGHMMLIYPAHQGFLQPPARLSMEEELHCWLVPFDLERECLVEGEWERYFPCLVQDKRFSLDVLGGGRRSGGTRK